MTVNVLAIDDSRTIRALLSSTLEEYEFNVTTAVDGVEGLEKFETCAPNVVITDINMPRLDGFGVIDAIRSGTRNKTIPIIVLSTESGAALKDRARTAGATGWIVKPFEEKSLISVLKRITGV